MLLRRGRRIYVRRCRIRSVGKNAQKVWALPKEREMNKEKSDKMRNEKLIAEVKGDETENNGD